jgi:hypothetical protein
VVPIDAPLHDHPIHRTVRFSHQVEATCLLFLAGLITRVYYLNLQTSITLRISYSGLRRQFHLDGIDSIPNVPPCFLAFKSMHVFLENCQYCTASLCSTCSGRTLKGKSHKITARADHFVEGGSITYIYLSSSYLSLCGVDLENFLHTPGNSSRSQYNCPTRLQIPSVLRN